jgi:hypothetical protein
VATPDEQEVPAGAGVFPLIPAELGVHPLLLAVLHATVFLSATDEKLLDTGAAEEALDYVAGYLRRLGGPVLVPVRNDLAALAEFGRRQKWAPEAVEFVSTFLETCGVEGDPRDG